MKLFGTDGIRGKSGVYPLIPDAIEKIGYFSAKITDTKNVLLGKDTRESSDEIETHLIQGLKKAGCRVFRLGIITTPGVSYLTRNKGGLGIIITASHNPYNENGIKFFASNGGKLSGEIERKIEESLKEEIGNWKLLLTQVKGREIGNGNIEDASCLISDYKEFLKSSSSSLSGIKVVIDCANGSGFEIFPCVLSEMGARIIALSNTPDGKNINNKCGALYPEETAKIVVFEKADLGLCLDGDGDRLVAIDEKGGIFNGDFMLGLFAKELKKRRMLKNNLVVGTIMTNMALETYLKTLDINLIRADVGDKHVFLEMKKHNAILGGEPSGHIIFEGWAGDGILTSIKLMEIVKQKGFLSSLRGFKPYPQIIINVKVKEKPKLEDIPGFSDYIKERENLFSDFGRILVRYSGTEPYLRIMIEGKDNNLIKEIGDRLSKIARENIGDK